MTLRRREPRPELMDRPDVDPRELERSLADLTAVNRWLGGTCAVLRQMATLLPPTGPARVLDVATGAADIPLAIARWGRTRHRDVRVTALDLHPGTLRYARTAIAGRPAVDLVRADARALPFDDGVFDLAVCSTALHHFEEPDAVEVLREMRRVSADAVLVQDLRRSWPAVAGVELLARTWWRRHPVTRHDGRVSVRAAFTPDELRGLARRGGLEGATVRRAAPFRLLLVDRAGVP